MPVDVLVVGGGSIGERHLRCFQDIGCTMALCDTNADRRRELAERYHLAHTFGDIADAAVAKGVKIERRQVELDKPIKSLGMHKLHVALHPEVAVEITVNVARSAEEAEFLAKGGVLVADREAAERQADIATQNQQMLEQQPEAATEAEKPAA